MAVSFHSCACGLVRHNLLHRDNSPHAHADLAGNRLESRALVRPGHQFRTFGLGARKRGLHPSLLLAIAFQSSNHDWFRAAVVDVLNATRFFDLPILLVER